MDEHPGGVEHPAQRAAQRRLQRGGDAPGQEGDLLGQGGRGGRGRFGGQTLPQGGQGAARLDLHLLSSV